MTLEEYKRQVKEITQASQNFNGTPEEAVKFFEYLAKKYPTHKLTSLTQKRWIARI